MKLPESRPNIEGCDREAHTLSLSLDLPICCPVSRNPRPGSTLTICYRPGALVLEIASLYAYIHQYQGGLKDEHGTVVVRDMETMIGRIAGDCAQVVGMPVTVCAHLVLTPKQCMTLFVRKKPVMVPENNADARGQEMDE